MEWIIGGGPVMYPLLFCSILSLAIIFERAISLRRGKVIRSEIIETINSIRSPEDVPLAFSKCEVLPGPFSNIVKQVLSQEHSTREEKVAEIQVTGKQETKFLEKRLFVLEIIAAVSPLLGLLGTILGLNEIFTVISVKGLGETKAFSYGISEALRTTILGLFVAIPTMSAYSYFDKKVEYLVHEMERHCTILLNKLYSFSSVSSSERVASNENRNVGSRKEKAASFRE